MLSVFASGRDESELVRFGWGFATGSGGADGVIPSVASQNRKAREGEEVRENLRVCVSVIVTSSDPPARVPVERRGEWG